MGEWKIVRQLAWREIYSRRKIFTITTSLLVVIVAAGMIFALGAAEDPDEFTILHSVDLPAGFTGTLTNMLEEGTVLEFERADDADSMRAALEEGEGEVGITGPLEALWGPGAPFGLRNAVLTALTATSLEQTAGELGLSPGELSGLLATADGENVKGEEDIEGEILASMAVVLSFMAIVTYGQWVAYGVVEEKNNRIIEIILGTASPHQVLWAKIISIGSLGLVQFVVLIGLTLGLGIGLVEVPIPEVAVSTGAWLILWFILGYGFYAALFASAGSLASNSQEASNSVAPLVIIPMTGYFMALPMLSEPTPSLGLKILAFLPPWSPLIIPGMLARGWISPLLASAAAVLVAFSVWLVVRLAARIYAGGVSESTKTVGWREAFRAGSDLLK